MADEDHVTAHLCMTKDIGLDGNLFGGNMMAWLDQAGAIYAHRQTGITRMVTLKFSELIFKSPVKVGELVDFYASNPELGLTSITFDLVGRVGGRLVVRTSCTFVAVDAAGRPMPINRC